MYFFLCRSESDSSCVCPQRLPGGDYWSTEPKLPRIWYPRVGVVYYMPGQVWSIQGRCGVLPVGNAWVVRKPLYYGRVFCCEKKIRLNIEFILYLSCNKFSVQCKHLKSKLSHISKFLCYHTEQSAGISKTSCMNCHIFSM